MVVFGSRGLQGVKLRCGEMEVEEAEEYKYLGMLFEKTGWKKHKDKMVRKARRVAAIAWSMVTQVGKLSIKAKLRMYNALVRPHLEYGAEIFNDKWGEAESVHVSRENRLQKNGELKTSNLS